MSGPSLAMAHTTASMTGTSAAVLAANGAREYALVVNDGSATCYLNLGSTAVANTGIRINANGGFYEISRRWGNLYTGAINGIAANGSATLIVTEGI